MKLNLFKMYNESIEENVPKKNQIFGVLHAIGQQVERKLYGEQNKIKTKFDSIKNKCLSQVSVIFKFYIYSHSNYQNYLKMNFI